MSFLNKAVQIIQISRNETWIKTYKYLFIILTLTVGLVSYSYFSINPFGKGWLIAEMSEPKISHQVEFQYLSASPTELIFDTVRNNKTLSQTFKVTNQSDSVIQITDIVSSSDKFTLSSFDQLPISLAQGQTIEVGVLFEPGSALGVLNGTISLMNKRSIYLTLSVYGLSTKGFEDIREPTLTDVVTALGYDIDVGWTGLHSDITAPMQGDEINIPLFQKADTGSVHVVPLARYSPQEVLPYGYYTKNHETPVSVQLGALADSKGEHQTLFPALLEGGTSFNPKNASFGIYVYSNKFKRSIYTEDLLNHPKIYHRSRIYPLRNRQGQNIANSYLICFEDASNGDYQDYVFLISNVRPADSPHSNDNRAILANINVGGSTYTENNGQVWVADTYYNGGQVLSESFEIQGRGKDALYLTNRYGKSFSYSIPLKKPGQVTVKLLFLERDFGLTNGRINNAGRRIFNIDIENGQEGDHNFDLNGWIIPGKAFIRSYENIMVNDSILNINFTSIKDQAMVSAIQVLDASAQNDSSKVVSIQDDSFKQPPSGRF